MTTGLQNAILCSFWLMVSGIGLWLFTRKPREPATSGRFGRLRYDLLHFFGFLLLFVGIIYILLVLYVY